MRRRRPVLPPEKMSYILVRYVLYLRRICPIFFVEIWDIFFGVCNMLLHRLLRVWLQMCVFVVEQMKNKSTFFAE